MIWCIVIESKVIPFLESNWSKVSKNVQDFENWTKIGGVIAKKLGVGQLQNSAIERAVLIQRI